MTQLWLEFILMALFIIVSGTYLSRFGDIIADKSGLGQAFIGGILIAMATSFPVTYIVTVRMIYLYDKKIHWIQMIQ